MNIAVVTVHLNDFEGLRSTFRSVQPLLGRSGLHWVVIDGLSQCSSPWQSGLFEEIRRHALHMRSEPDAGIYDAMNKGTAVAAGEYVLYLNAGDELHAGFSPELLEGELGGRRPAMVWGVCHERYPNGELVRVKNRSPRLAWYGIPVNHQNVLFRRDLLGSRPYDERFRFCADYDLISRILRAGGEVHRTGMPIAIFARGGMSARNFQLTMREEEGLRTVHYGLNPAVSRAITVVKQLNHRAASIPGVRRIMRRWV